MRAERPPEPRGWLFAALCSLLVASVYIKSLGGPFLWDDSRLIVESPETHSLAPFDAFLRPFWLGAPGEPGSSAYFRPITSLSLAFDYRLHGENPAGYHLTNLVVHLAATLLLFALLRRRGVGVRFCFLLSVCWALLPRLTEGVAWISGRGDVLAGFFALLALWVYRDGGRLRLALAAGLSLLAAFSKESGLAGFVALGVLVLGNSKLDRRARFRDLAILAAPVLLYVTLRLHAGATAGSPGMTLAPGARLLAIAEAVGRYLAMLGDMFRPRTLLGRLGQPSFAFIALGALGLLAVPFAIARLRRAPAATLAYVGLGALPLLLVLHVVPLPTSVVSADRYLYLPTAALLLASAPTLATWLERYRPAAIGLLLLALALGARTSQRLDDYADVTSFWLAATRDTPSEAVPLEELAAEAYRSGCFAESLQLNQRALRLNDSSSPHALENAALVANLMGQRELSNRLGDQLLSRHPGVASFELRRGASALAALDFEAARTHAQRALRLDPGFVRAKELLGRVESVREGWQARESAALESGLALEMRALRYPETVEALRQLLASPSANEQSLRDGLELVIASGTPEDARELVGSYLARHTPPDAARLAEAVALRVETAAALRRRLTELLP